MNPQNNLSWGVSEAGEHCASFKEIQNLEISAYKNLSTRRHLHYQRALCSIEDSMKDSFK